MMSGNIVFEGWLTKSPPTKRIWRTKWRRRWFALRQSGELPGQYFLDYYAERNCRRLKGTINLDLCEQVDAGLHMERSGSGSLDPKLRGSVFTIQTQSRTYHLEADCEDDMEKWVDAICKVCGLRATDNSSKNLNGPYQNNSTLAAMNEQYECPDNTGPYIRISECITGNRTEDPKAFTFDTDNIMTSSRALKTASDSRARTMSLSQPQIRLNPEFSENDSNLSDDECKSLNASQSHIGDWSVTKSFTKLTVAPRRPATSEDGPPVPPRPPKTLAVPFRSNMQREPYFGPRMSEPLEAIDYMRGGMYGGLYGARRGAHASPPSPARAPRLDDEDEYAPGHPSMQYCNVTSLPPAVDRALKPRHCSLSVSHGNSIDGEVILHIHEGMKGEALQYLDLDLQTSKPEPSKPQEMPTRKDRLPIVHGKSQSEVEVDCAYKTVDFLKTEAFNITRQDAEASRSNRL